MGGEVCINRSCKSGSVSEWKNGWPLNSGGFARLCNNCGSAYENSVFCDKFHHHEPGWRECNYCNKPIHCGCIVSRSLFVCLDYGGIGCVHCVKASKLCLIQDTENPNESDRSTKKNAIDHYAERIDGRLPVESADKGKLMELCTIAEACKSSCLPQSYRDGIVSSIGPNSPEVKCPLREEDTGFSNIMKNSSHSLMFTTSENNRPTWGTKSIHQPLSLKISMGTSSRSCILPSASEIVKDRLEGKASSPFYHGKKSYPIHPKPSKTGVTMNLETNKSTISLARNVRPPADGKGKTQLLSRYWPKITDQELEQLSGDLKSTVVPLFEKVLSASDAGRIGRLVLPKACAEAYFPPISHSDGVPLYFQDVKGNEWTFQFRFWPNNNSRMYVLEGVTPCIQSMSLNAGDTVTFSRIDPGGKFVMGFRRASSSIDTQDASTSAHSNGIPTKDTNFSGANENLHSGSSYPDLLQSTKGKGEPYLNGHSEHLRLGTRTVDWLQSEHCEEVMDNDPLQRLISVSEKKRTCNIGLKTKRLRMHSEEAMELRLTWEEAQDLLCPPPSVKPSIVTIEDHVFEEYDEPPVFGKRITTNGHPSGSSCSASEQLSPKGVENLPKTNKDSKKRKRKEKTKPVQEQEPSGLDALASLAVLGDNHADTVDSSAGATTKHPRHRPGCTCIVCIQPPSGKGRHKPTCTCLACETVKRRLKTQMTRKKKQQSESEAVVAQNDQIQSESQAVVAQTDQIHNSDEPGTNKALREDTSQSPKEVALNRGQVEVVEPSAGQIDLNSHPSHEDMEVDTT